MRSLRRAVPVVAMAMLVALGCEKTVPPPKAIPAAPLGYIPKCPGHPFKLEVAELDKDTGHVWVKHIVTTIDLSGDLTPVVEVHDCQRLILSNSGADKPLSYGPLALIFAGDSVKTLLTNPGDSQVATTRPQRAAAVIYSWWKDDPRTGDYPALGIEGGWNCLYLSPSGGGVVARMVPARRQDECLKPASAEGTMLEVHTQAPPSGMTADDIPAVARWGWAVTQGGPTNDIWVRCGGLACEVGPMGFKPEADLPADVRHAVLAKIGTSREAQRLFAFKGWYDQQLLAVVEPPGGLEVSGVRATLFPWPNLGAQNTDSKFDVWQQVALAYLPEEAAGYGAKLNLESGINEISMRRGKMTSALPAGRTVVRTCNNTGDQWWAMIRSKSGVQYFCMTRYLHGLPPDKMPGTVRWRWLDDDESTWIRCPKGCCPIG